MTFRFYHLLCLLGFLVLLPGTCVRAQEVLEDRNFIRIDQFGYPTTGIKVAVIARALEGYNAGHGLELNRSAPVEVVRAGTDDVLFSAFPKVWNGGSTDGLSGDRGYWFDFTGLTDTGTFRIRLTKQDGSQAESYDFRIADDVYHDVLRAAVQFFYYQRINQEKTAEYASGEPWTDGAWYERPEQEYAVKQLDNPSNTRSMPKGWFDAGDPNKYVTFAVDAVHALLTTYDQYADFWNDFDLNIPESGDEVPDLLDEIRWETDWLESMQDFDLSDSSGSGGFYQKMGILNDVSYISPPSTDTRERWFNQVCVSSSITGSSMLAHAALSYQRAGVWPEKVAELRERAERAWDYYIAAPNKEERCDDGRIEAGDADGPGDQYATEHRALATAAAVYLYELTGEETYHDFIKANYTQTRPWKAGDWGIYRAHQAEAVLYYTALPGADPATRQAILNRKTSAEKSEGGNYLLSETDNLYRARAFYFNWGSNSLISRQVGDIMDFQAYDLKPGNHGAYQERAQSIINYLHGTNPSGICMLSNMYRYGGDLCADEMWHSWFSLDTRFDNLDGGNVGPAPGFISGGPNPQGNGNMPIKLGTHSFPATTGQQPGQKAFSVDNYWEYGPWAYNEPAIYYQAAYVKALAHFAAGALAPGVTGGGLNAVNDCNEAEIIFTVANDVGANAAVAADPNSPGAAGGTSVALFDAGDAATLSFDLAATGSFDLAVRVRVGEASGDETNLAGEYTLTLDGTEVEYTLDPTSVTPLEDDTYWGELIVVNTTLTEGNHELTVTARQNWLKLDALCWRDPNSIPTEPTEQASFFADPLVLPGTIQTEHYDKGGQGVAYNDSDASNNGGAFRTDEGVDMAGTAGGGVAIGWVSEGEWVEYTVNVERTGIYNLSAAMASPETGGRLQITLSANSATSSISLPAGGTGGWNDYEVLDAAIPLSLLAGEQILRLDIAETPAFNIDSLIFEFDEEATDAAVINYSDELDGADDQFSGEPAGIVYSITDGVLNVIGDGTSGRFQVFSYALHDGAGTAQLANVVGSNDLLYLRARTTSGNPANLRVDLVDDSNYHTTNAGRNTNIAGPEYTTYSFNYAGGYEDGGYGGTDCTDDIKPCPVNGGRITGITFYPESTTGEFNDTIQIDWLSFGEPLMVNVRDFAEIERLRLFPNPARDAFGVDYRLLRPADLQLQLFDGTGRPVLERDLGQQPAGDGFAKIDLGKLPAGAYFFRLAVDGRTTRARVVMVR